MMRIEENMGVARDEEGLRQLLMRLGERWTVTVLATLGQKRLRFNVLRRDIDGISQRMLTLSLRNLERDGLVVRTVFPTVPPRVEYELSKPGQSLLETLVPIRAWIAAHCKSVADSRRLFDL